MQLALSTAAILFALVVLGYMHALSKFYALVKAERPDWVDRRGSLSIFYAGMPRLADPNVSLATIGLAFSPRRHELRSPSASRYADRIRVLLPFGLVLFVGILAMIFAAAP